MNQRYMDFVPKNKKLPVKKPVEVRKPVPVAEEPEVMNTKATDETPVEEDVILEDYFAVDDTPRRARAEKSVEYGVIEEYRPKFVRTEIKKRPLGQPDEKFAKSKASASEIAEVKAKKLVGKKAEGVASSAASEKKATSEKKTEETLKVPKARFVNTDKIEKRPLSKNVYKKKVVAPKEEPKGPVTIISKLDDGSHVGVIVTIILTIILGAAAGTVAFLLLPK